MTDPFIKRILSILYVTAAKSASQRLAVSLDSQEKNPAE
jgi:hypothetical protein